MKSDAGKFSLLAPRDTKMLTWRADVEIESPVVTGDGKKNSGKEQAQPPIERSQMGDRKTSKRGGRRNPNSKEDESFQE